MAPQPASLCVCILKIALYFRGIVSHAASWHSATSQPTAEPNLSLNAKAHLTEISIRALKPSDGQITYWDVSLPNFGVRVVKQRKTFVLLVGDDRQRVSLGVYPATTLADARKAARQRLAERTLGVHRPAPLSFGEALTLFLATHSKQHHSPRTAHEYRRILEQHFH
jgi:hypothetical protein